MSEHEHAWEPVRNWYGRYRCARCGVLGYRGVTQPPVHSDSKPEVIFPYICTMPNCERGAVKSKNVRRFCAEHAKGR